MTQTTQNRISRAIYSKDVKPIYDSLTEGDDKEEAPFETNKDVFMLAACMGFWKGVPNKLPSGGRFDIRLDVFSEREIDILKGIAVAHTEDVKILEDDYAFLDIVEEYAHGGIKEVKAQLLDKPGAVLWNLVSIL